MIAVELETLILQFAGSSFMSLDAYENVMNEYKMIYNPEVIRLIYEINVLAD